MSWQNAQLIRTLSERSGPVAGLAFSPDGQILVSGSCDSAVKLWHLETGERLHSLFGYPLGVNAAAISPDGQILAIGAPDGTVDLWQLSAGADGRPQGSPVRTLRGGGRVTAIAFTPDGQTLISGSDDSFSDTVFATPSRFGPSGAGGGSGGTLNLWQVRTGFLLGTVCEPSAPVNAVAVSPDGKTLASAHRDSSVKLWQLSAGGFLQSHTLNGHADAVYSAAISPGGQMLATGSGDGTVKLWHLPAGTECHTLKGHADAVYAVAFSPNGQTAASGSGDGTTAIWDTGTGERLHTLTGDSQHSHAVMTVAFSPDGRTLVSGSGDGTIKIWRANGLPA
ncbi:MAG: WD40 repeat domain-containing protein [Oscillatoria princeps RMCB-10]|jgi:WD40 repeat protein|nr:WD40 repeat domain-containing protein [Oscillatoria princeps RMCB-10]